MHAARRLFLFEHHLYRIVLYLLQKKKVDQNFAIKNWNLECFLLFHLLSFTSFAFRGGSGFHQPSGTSGKHTVTRHCDHGTFHARACACFNLQWSNDSVGLLSVINLQCHKLTLICIVFHFELKVPCVRLHCQHATLQVLLFAIMGVFKGNVFLERGTKKVLCLWSSHA